MEKITPERIAEVVRKLENMEAGCIPAAVSLIRDLAHDLNSNAVGIGALKAMKEERDKLKTENERLRAMLEGRENDSK